MNIARLALSACFTASMACQRFADSGDTTGTSGGGSSQEGMRAPPVPKCAAASTYGSPLPPVENRAARLVLQSVHEWEGPVWVPMLAALFFSEIDYDAAEDAKGAIRSTLKALTPSGSLADFLAQSGSSGLALAGDGQLLAAVYDTRTLATFDVVHQTRADLALLYRGKHLNAPRGVTVRSDGNAYFTDPASRLAEGQTELGFTGVFRLSPANDVTLVDSALHNPLGLTLGLEEASLYVSSEDGNGAVTKYAVAVDGSVSGGAHFVDVPHPAGMTMDCAGHLYVGTGGGTVAVFDANGMQVGEIGVGPRVIDVAFGGPEQKTLFITTGTPSPALFAIDLNVPGLPN